VNHSDYRMNGQVRALLVRRGIELGRLEFGVTNSVVYVRGTVRSYLYRQSDNPSEARLRMVDEVAQLERALRSIPGVRDVVMQVNRMTKVGRRWKTT
jgi:osmotically-inducible protein OsmY